MTEEINARVGVISGLRVVSRMSALTYQNTDLPLSQIAEELGVGYVVQGTIRTDRTTEGVGQVRVTPELTRASDGVQLWADVYTASLVPGELFRVQGEIAERVAEGLNVTLSPEEQQAIEDRPTENAAAYDAYLRGMDYFRLGTLQEWDAQRIALENFESAVTLDPDFALAHVMHGLAHLRLVNFDQSNPPYLNRSDRLAFAKEALDHALRLDPDLPEIHLALSRYHRASRDTARSEDELAVVLQERPNDPEAILSMGLIQAMRGARDSAGVLFKKKRLTSIPGRSGL